MKRITSLLQLFAAALIAVPMPASAFTFTPYNTGTAAEKFSSLPVNTAKVLYSLQVDTISAGDVLVVDNELEMGNPSATATLAVQLILADSATATTGTSLDTVTQQGISPAMSVNKRFKGAIKKFDTALTGTKYVNVVVSSDVQLAVRSDSGSVQVLKISP